MSAEEFCEVHGCKAPRCTLEEEGVEGSGTYDVECVTYDAQFKVHLIKQGRLEVAYCPGCGRCAHERVYSLTAKARAEVG